MGKIDNQENWEKIQMSIKETERLMGQKKYNHSMLKARQTMEFMVKLQCDKSGLVENSTEQMIKQLYRAEIISKSTAEHYMQILTLGNKAEKEGDNSAYNANQAYHVLSQEIYAFADTDKVSKPRRNTATRQAAAQPQSRKRQASSGTQSPKSSKSSGMSAGYLIKFLIPIAVIVILIVAIKLLGGIKSDSKETTAAAASTPIIATEAPVADTEAAPELPTEPAASVTYKTTTTLNVRSGPSTDVAKLGKLDPGATVTYLRDYDDFWAVILYNDIEAYVAKEYLTAVEE